MVGRALPLFDVSKDIGRILPDRGDVCPRGVRMDKREADLLPIVGKRKARILRALQQPLELGIGR